MGEGADGHESDDGAGRRARTQPVRDGFVDSSTMQVGSSSPAPPNSQTSSLDFVDQGSHMSASQPEDGTYHLIRCAFRHVLHYAPPQDKPQTDMEAVVEVRDAKVRLSYECDAIKLVAVDDGGLCLRRQLKQANPVVFDTIKNRVVIFEMKPSLRCFEEGQPTISDACLAQMTCQALTAKLEDPQRELAHGSVLMMHAAQHYVCFLEFKIKVADVGHLRLDNPDTFTHVYSTPWYDLGSRDGRTNFAKIMSTIMIWAAEA